MLVITVSRQLGSLGDEIAQALSQKLGWDLITHETVLNRFLSDIANPFELRMLNESAKAYLKKTGGEGTFLDILGARLREFTSGHSAVLIGFGSQMIFAGDKDALHLRVVAPQSVRLARIKKQYRISEEEAAANLQKSDRKQRRFVSTLFGADIGGESHYDLTLNTARLSVYECEAAVTSLLKERESNLQLGRSSGDTRALNNLSEFPLMKNPSEVEFARILDMYHMEWVYEPKTFPIEWDAEGNVRLAFSPDFYLKDFDTYIELTTMNQKYITLKNKKIKKLRELYPGINIKIVNKRDFLSLIDRFKSVRGE